MAVMCDVGEVAVHRCRPCRPSRHDGVTMADGAPSDPGSVSLRNETQVRAGPVPSSVALGGGGARLGDSAKHPAIPVCARSR